MPGVNYLLPNTAAIGTTPSIRSGNLAMSQRKRRGVTLVELIAVMAVLIILGGVILPTLTATRRDVYVKAAADMVRGRMAEARSKAIENGQAYRFAISEDGRRIRIAPDTYEALGEVATSDDDSSPILIREDDLPKGVTLQLTSDEAEFAVQDSSGWKRLVTFQPDGTCREDSAEVIVSEKGVTPLLITVRGLTGATTTSKMPATAGAKP